MRSKSRWRGEVGCNRGCDQHENVKRGALTGRPHLTQGMVMKTGGEALTQQVEGQLGDWVGNGFASRGAAAAHYEESLGNWRPLLLTWAPWWSRALARRQVGRSHWDKTGLGVAGGSDGASGAHRLLLQTAGTLGTWERYQLPREATQGNWDEAKAGALKVAWNESVRKQYPGSV